MEANLQVDETYEFSAPRFFDFLNDETEEQIQKAERWFETSLSYGPSPFMPKITKGRSVINCPCDIGVEEKIHKKNQAIKKQKLDKRGSKKMHDIKAPVLLHKSKTGLSGGNDLLISGVKGHQEQRKELAPYISTAEMVQKFQSRTREIELPQNRSFLQEFHLKTMERANQHAEKASVVSSSADASSQNQCKVLKLTEPRPPILQTSLRARPTRIKSSQELELEEIERIPKFKARPLNKKIFKSKGDLGLLCQSKSQIRTQHEFHFATNDRLGPPRSTMMKENFDKLSLHSDSSYHSQQCNPKITKPIPFHLHTEERGHEKEKLFKLQIIQKQLEEEKARIPKENPYPYSTDYPAMPPKPQPKQITKTEIFHLDSLIRHEEEMQKMMEERERMEREKAERRIFRAQPIMKEDPFPLPERERKPLTDVQEFVLHVDYRAVKRSEFDKKMKEKELTNKRIREEQENAKMIEEEKVIKQMRRTMVPHARPIPKFDNPFNPQRSTKEKIKPKSPKLLVKQREMGHALQLNLLSMFNDATI